MPVLKVLLWKESSWPLMTISKLAHAVFLEAPYIMVSDKSCFLGYINPHRTLDSSLPSCLFLLQQVQYQVLESQLLCRNTIAGACLQHLHPYRKICVLPSQRTIAVAICKLLHHLHMWLQLRVSNLLTHQGRQGDIPTSIQQIADRARQFKSSEATTHPTKALRERSQQSGPR